MKCQSNPRRRLGTWIAFVRWFFFLETNERVKLRRRPYTGDGGVQIVCVEDVIIGGSMWWRTSKRFVNNTLFRLVGHGEGWEKFKKKKKLAPRTLRQGEVFAARSVLSSPHVRERSRLAYNNGTSIDLPVPYPTSGTDHLRANSFVGARMCALTGKAPSRPFITGCRYKRATNRVSHS